MKSGHSQESEASTTGKKQGTAQAGDEGKAGTTSRADYQAQGFYSTLAGRKTEGGRSWGPGRSWRERARGSGIDRPLHKTKLSAKYREPIISERREMAHHNYQITMVYTEDRELHKRTIAAVREILSDCLVLPDEALISVPFSDMIELPQSATEKGADYDPR